MSFQYLFQLKNIFSSYFTSKWNEESIRENFTLVFELIDETMDYGYPQNCSIEALRMYINLGSERAQDKAGSTLTEAITGKTDWRRPDIKYRKNEVYIDVLESVNLLLSANGTVLSQSVSGQVMMKVYLSGWPECKFGLNDKIVIDREAQSGQKIDSKGVGVDIEDCSFHRCVRLGKFDADRTITFIPPDGEFELMRYRITDNVNLPFRVMPVLEEHGRSRVSYNVKVVANFPPKLYATNVVFKFPCPPTTARANITVTVGRAKYEPAQKCIVWKIHRFSGGTELSFGGQVELISSTTDKPWVRAPILVEFQVPMFTSSGLHVRFLKILEKTGYKTTKWVRYITRAGQYQIRI